MSLVHPHTNDINNLVSRFPILFNKFCMDRMHSAELHKIFRIQIEIIKTLKIMFLNSINAISSKIIKQSDD